MKARLNLQQFADVTKVTEELRAKLSFVPGKTSDGKPAAIAVYPEGTIFEGPMAVQLCRTGQATPADDECAKAVDASPAKLAALQLDYKMNTLGINSKEDRELYKAGVIAGYNKDGKTIPGPNWEAYQKAKEEADAEDDI